MCEYYDCANWWKRDEHYDNLEPKDEVENLTDTEKKIAHYEKQARRHWHSWKTYDSKTYLYHYKQANIKIRKLTQLQARNIQI